MSDKILVLLFSLILSCPSFAQKSELNIQIDSLYITVTESTPFNGIVLVSVKGKAQYSKCFGSSDYFEQKSFNLQDQFVIGSISKQITAVLILREYDKGNLQLHTPIRKYLPTLPQSWADTVTIHQLLTHTHGIIELDQPLAFPAGSQFQYSQIGYALLADIVEKVTGKSFALTSKKLFQVCKMKSTTHPGLHEYNRLVTGYTVDASGTVVVKDNSFENYVPAGGFVSTAGDLTIWNECLHKGKLLSDSTYALMIKKYATREHPIFGPTDYGYGISVGKPEGVVQLGQTGYAPGYISMDFYFPETETSVIVLENIDWNPENIKNAFYYHVRTLQIVRENIKNSSEK